MSVDFANWAVVGYKDDTGLGRMAEDIKAVLGVAHLVAPSERLSAKALEGAREVVLNPSAPDAEVEHLLQRFQGIIVLETHGWHPRLLSIARRTGVRTVCVPMWEWFRGTDTQWRCCDLFICPSAFCLEVVRGYGWKNSVHLPWTLALARFPPREVKGPARIFIHNGGLVDPDDRKGTRDTIRAFGRVRRRDLRLIVRLQEPAALPDLDPRIELRVGNLAKPSELYAEGEAAIQPSKMEGLGFMVLEAVCSGLAVISTDYPPMNEYIRHRQLLVRKRWFRRRAFPGRAAGIRHAHMRLPSLSDLSRKIAWCAENDLTQIARVNRAWAEERFNPGHLRSVWQAALEHLGSAQK